MIPNTVFHVFFGACLGYFLFGLYGPSVYRSRKSHMSEAASRPLDLLADFTIFLAWQVLPLVHILTDWLDSADYSLPPWMSSVGAALLVIALVVLRRAYADLGANWSPRIDVLKDHELVTHGVYEHVRHPIYVGMGLWAAGQPLLIHNWIAGPAFLAVFLPAFLLRAPKEERALITRFGRTYLDYMAKTPGLFPRLRRRDRPS